MNSSATTMVTRSFAAGRTQIQSEPPPQPAGDLLLRQRRLPAVLAIASLVMSAKGLVAQENAVEYTFGRPVEEGEHTYDWYRKTHAEEAARRYGVDAKAVGDGMDTWHWWCGVDNPELWRDLTVLGATKGYTAADGRLDFFRMLMTTSRADRWFKMGLMNDPDTDPADKPDQYGLTLDRAKEGALTWDPEVFGYPSGVLGLQLFTNKRFDARKWSVKKYLDDPSSVEPPYLVGQACVLCHVGFDPSRPPSDPVNPKWENLSSNIGNQYFREGMLGGGLEADRKSFAYQYLYNQQPGTSETSRFPADFINGPVHVNSIYRLGQRLKLARPERITLAQRDLIRSIYANCGLKEDDPGGALGGTETEPTLKVPHVLSDGADSMGIVIASARVYVNEGCMHELWVPTTWALNPFDLKESLHRNFKPGEFDLFGAARKDPNSPWMQTERRMPNLALFLGTYDSYPLASAKEADGDDAAADASFASHRPRKDGKDYLTTDTAVLTRGKIAFANSCARCHSSKVPDPMPSDPQGQSEAWRRLVQRDDF